MVLDMSELHTVKEKSPSLSLRTHFKGQTDLGLNPDLMKKYQLCDIVQGTQPLCALVSLLKQQRW